MQAQGVQKKKRKRTNNEWISCALVENKFTQGMNSD